MDEVRRTSEHRPVTVLGVFLAPFFPQKITPSRIGLCCLFLLCFVHNVFSQTTDKNRARKQKIAAVRFEGNTHIAEYDLSVVVQTRSAGFLDKTINFVNSNWGLPAQYIDQSLLDHDTIAIYELYRNIGYLEAKVSYRIEEDTNSLRNWQKVDAENKLRAPADWQKYPEISVSVIYHIQENEPYLVGGFTFEGLENLPPDLIELATKDIGIKKDTVFSRAAIAKEYRRIQLLLEENGYPFFSRDQVTVDIDKKVRKVYISIPFRTGNRYKFGDIVIRYDSTAETGSTVSESAIRRQLRFAENEWFSSSKLRASERNIYSLGTFDAAHIGLDTSAVANLPDFARDGKSLPVIIGLKMHHVADVSPGIRVGLGTGTTFAAKVGFSHRNLFGGAEPFSLDINFQFLPTLQTVYDFGASLAFPGLSFRNTSPLRLTANMSRFAQRIIDSMGTHVEKFHLQKISGTANISYDLSQGSTPQMSIAPGGTIEYTTSFFAQTYSKEIRQRAGLPQFNFIFNGDFVIDGTNNPLNPESGGSIKYSAEVGLPFLAKIFAPSLPSASYFKNTMQLREYLMLDAKGTSVIATRLYGGTAIRMDPINTLSDVPITRLYYGGGPTSLRGWGSRRLLVSSKDSADPTIGGYTRLEANIEYRFSPFKVEVERSAYDALLSPITFALFCDAGNVWDKDTKINFSDVAIAIGFGLRYNFFFGPARLDFGYRLYDPSPPDRYDPVSKTYYPVAIKPGAGGKWGNPFKQHFNLEITIGDPFQ